MNMLCLIIRRKWHLKKHSLSLGIILNLVMRKRGTKKNSHWTLIDEMVKGIMDSTGGQLWMSSSDDVKNLKSPSVRTWNVDRFGGKDNKWGSKTKLTGLGQEAATQTSFPIWKLQTVYLHSSKEENSRKEKPLGLVCLSVRVCLRETHLGNFLRRHILQLYFPGTSVPEIPIVLFFLGTTK